MACDVFILFSGVKSVVGQGPALDDMRRSVGECFVELIYQIYVCGELPVERCVAIRVSSTVDALRCDTTDGASTYEQRSEYGRSHDGRFSGEACSLHSVSHLLGAKKDLNGKELDLVVQE